MSFRIPGVMVFTVVGLLLATADSASQDEISGSDMAPASSGFDASVPFADPELEAEVTKLARQLRCPTCQAHSIEDSPSGISQQMKGVIRDQLREGMTPEQIREHFVSAYGEWILLSPTPVGFNLLVYFLPFVALLAGFAIVVVGMRSWMRSASATGADDPMLPPS